MASGGCSSGWGSPCCGPTCSRCAARSPSHCSSHQPAGARGENQAVAAASHKGSHLLARHAAQTAGVWLCVQGGALLCAHALRKGRGRVSGLQRHGDPLASGHDLNLDVRVSIKTSALHCSSYSCAPWGDCSKFCALRNAVLAFWPRVHGAGSFRRWRRGERGAGYEPAPSQLSCFSRVVNHHHPTLFRQWGAHWRPAPLLRSAALSASTPRSAFTVLLASTSHPCGL